MASKVFQHNIRVLRNSKALSQEWFAEEIESTRSTVGSWEEGRSEPNIIMLITIADYFKITVDELIRKKITL